MIPCKKTNCILCEKGEPRKQLHFFLADGRSMTIRSMNDVDEKAIQTSGYVDWLSHCDGFFDIPKDPDLSLDYPDCEECKGTGWYVGLGTKERCKTCEERSKGTLSTGIVGIDNIITKG